MNSVDDQQLFRADKIVKRGLVRQESHSPNQETLKDDPQRGRGSPTFLSLPTSSSYSDLKVGSSATTRSWRALDEYWTPRRYIIAIFLLLSIFGLAGSFMFANSIGRTPQLNEGFVIPYNSYPKLQRIPLPDPHRSPSDLDDVGNAQDDDMPVVGEDVSVYKESGVGFPSTCNEKDARLRVYMYDLPPTFHYGMLVQSPYPNGQIWPRNVSDMPPYPGGLYQQHSPEYWLTSDLLTSTMADRQSMCTAFRVDDWKLADVIFVPFFASLSYNKFTRSEQLLKHGGDKDRELQGKLMKFLSRQPAWQASGGADHVIVIHHPNSGYVMRNHLSNAMYVVADFGRYTSEVANIEKDVVAPYKHVVHAFEAVDATSFESRKTLLFFQGAIVRKQGGIIRQQLFELLKDEADVHFEAGNTTSAAIRSATAGMQGSKFCLNLAGDTPSSNRLFDAIASHCVPVVISDDIEVPFEDELDYSKFSLFVKSSDALKSGFVINLLRGVSSEEWMKMWRKLQEVDRHFEYQHPTKPDDAVHMTWKAIHRKVSKVRLLLNKERRYKISRSKLINTS